MATLKDSVVSGSLRVTDTLYSTTAQFQILRAPTSSNGTTYGPGTNGNFLKSNGTSVYWVSLAAADIPNISTDKLTSGTLPVGRGGTGVTAIANIQAGKDGDGNTISSTYLKLSGSTAITGNLGINTTNRGLFLTDSTGNEYAAIYDNGTNLWIGSSQQGTTTRVHTGLVYINAGWNGSSGNSSIYICVPTSVTGGGSPYLVAHAGNVSTGDSNGQIKIAGTNVSVKGLGSRAYDSTAYLPLTGTSTMTGTITSTASIGMLIKPASGTRAYLNLIPQGDNQADINFGRSNAAKWALSSRTDNEAFFGLYNHVKGAWSIKVEESTHNIITSGQLQVTNGSGNGIKMWKDGEGGNIRIYGKDDTSYYELDSYDNTSFRIVSSNTNNTTAHSFIRWLDNNTTAYQQLYSTSQGFIQHMRKVDTSGYHLGSFIVFNNSGTFSFYEYPTDNITGASTNREYYSLPAPTAGRTSEAGFKILTTKNTVTIGQGGTGRTSWGVNQVVITDANGALSQTASVPVTRGGTGATTAAAARSSLSVTQVIVLGDSIAKMSDAYDILSARLVNGETAIIHLTTIALTTLAGTSLTCTKKIGLVTRSGNDYHFFTNNIPGYCTSFSITSWSAANTYSRGTVYTFKATNA